MSISVPLEELERVMADRPLAYLVTAGSTAIKVMQCHPQWVGTVMHLAVGAGSVRNLAGRSDLVMVFPPSPDDAEQFSLLVDGEADVVDESHVVVRPVSAVLHRRLAS